MQLLAIQAEGAAAAEQRVQRAEGWPSGRFGWARLFGAGISHELHLVSTTANRMAWPAWLVLLGVGSGADGWRETKTTM